jgi:hypothetical protein
VNVTATVVDPLAAIISELLIGFDVEINRLTGVQEKASGCAGPTPELVVDGVGWRDECQRLAFTVSAFNAKLSGW